jgi:hypothetical protein
MVRVLGDGEHSRTWDIGHSDKSVPIPANNPLRCGNPDLPRGILEQRLRQIWQSAITNLSKLIRQWRLRREAGGALLRNCWAKDGDASIS